MTVGHNPPVLASPRCCIWFSRPGFQDLDIWLSRPEFYDSDRWTLGFTLKTWVSKPRYFALRTWVLGPRQTHRYRTSKALHPTVVLSFSRHFSLRPVVTDKRTDGQTDATSDFIYKIALPFYDSRWQDYINKTCLVIPFFFCYTTIGQ